MKIPFLTLLTTTSSLHQPYYFNPKIHSLGNVGFGGFVHSILARPFTKLIDVAGYGGVNIRDKVIRDLTLDRPPRFVIDFGCGTGTSTESLKKIYTDSTIFGVDTSAEMLRIASLFTSNEINYIIGNIETISFKRKPDLITIFFVLHEIPQRERLIVLENAKQQLNPNSTLLIVDIDPSYTPSHLMLEGEPYFENYRKNIEQDIETIFPNSKSFVEIENHVRVWKVESSTTETFVQIGNQNITTRR